MSQSREQKSCRLRRIREQVNGNFIVRSERRSSPLALLVCPSRSFQFAWFGLRKILVKVKPNLEKVGQS